MKIPGKQEPQLTAFNHSSDIDFKDFISIFTKMLKNHIPF